MMAVEIVSQQKVWKVGPGPTHRENYHVGRTAKVRTECILNAVVQDTTPNERSTQEYDIGILGVLIDALDHVPCRSGVR
jgi:hypothetical protein